MVKKNVWILIICKPLTLFLIPKDKKTVLHHGYMFYQDWIKAQEKFHDQHQVQLAHFVDSPSIFLWWDKLFWVWYLYQRQLGQFYCSQNRVETTLSFCYGERSLGFMDCNEIIAEEISLSNAFFFFSRWIIKLLAQCI